MIDLIRLRQDAEHVLETHGESPAGRVALGVLQILANPTLACPGDYFIGRRPILASRMNDMRREREVYRIRKDADELFDRGIPSRP